MDANAIITLAKDSDGSATACGHLDCLPILRWAGNIGGLTSRVDNVALWNPSSWFAAVPSNITSIFLSIGNNLWSAAASIERMADGSSAMMDSFGKMANKFTGAVWSALSSWEILSLAIILVVGTSLWRYIHNGTLQEFGQRMVALVLGLSMFAAMGIASSNNPDTDATLTPYWLVTTTNKYIGDVAGAAADTVVQDFRQGHVFLAHSYKDDTTGDLLSCRNYLNQLHEENSKAMETRGKSQDTILSAMNIMWEETGLRIYARTQYGPGENADQVFCRVPEYRAGATAQDMAYITTQAITNSYKNKPQVDWGNGTGDAMAWHPDLWEANLDDKDSSKVSSEGVYLDRWVTMWDTCGYDKKTNDFSVRSGWAFVNSIEGEDRGVDSDGNSSNDVTNLPMQCRAAIEAKTNKDDKKPNSKLQPSTLLDSSDSSSQKCQYMGAAHESCTSAVDTASDDFKSMKALTNKFNIRTDSNWRTLSQTHNNTKDETVINQAKTTLSYQQGSISASELGGAVVFSISAVINLLIWGVGFGLIKMLTLALASLVAAGGLWLGLLFYALSPDKGKRAVVNAAKQVGGMCAAGSVLGLVASTGCLFVTSAMAALGLCNGQGSTTGSTVLVAVASAALPIIYLWAVRYICVNVWKIGDPFSGEGLFKMIGGQALMGGLKALGGMAVGGAAGAIGAAMGGAGLKGVLGAAARGAGLDRMPGTVGRAVGTAAQAKDRAEYRRAMGLDGDRPKRAGSEADQAAVDRDDDGAPSEADASKNADQAAVDKDKGKGLFGDESPSDDEHAKAEKAVRDRYRKELEAKGLKGDDLESALDARMRSAQGLQAVDELADRLHSDAGISDEDRASARKAVYHKRAAELEKAGFKGESLKRELDRYMDSDKAKEQIDKLAGDRYERRVYGDDMKRATEAMRSQLRDKYAAQGLSGDGLERAVNAAMKTDATLARIRENAFGSHAANLLDGLSGNLSGERREAIAAADHAAAYDPTEAEMRQATDEFRQSITDDETRRLQASHPGLAAGSDEFQTMLAANVDHRMRGAGEDIRNRAQQLHHDAYMQRMGERVQSLDPNARSLFDQRMNAECDRLMGANPNLSIAEVQARARENLLTESNMNDIERQGVRHAIAGMNASVNGNDTDVLAAAQTLGIKAGADRLDDATDTVRARFTRQAASDGLTGVALERRVDGMMSSDMGRQAVQAQALRMDPQVAAQAATARGEAVDQATVQLMRTGAYGDTAGARAAAIAQNRLTNEYAAQGLSGKELDDRVMSMMSDPTVQARMAADADALRADPRQTARFDRMFDDVNAKLSGRYRTARMAGHGVLGATAGAVGGGMARAAQALAPTATAAGTAISGLGTTAAAMAKPLADHPIIATAATAAFAPVALPAVAVASVAAHTTLNGKGYVNKAFRKATPAAAQATKAAAKYASATAETVGNAAHAVGDAVGAAGAAAVDTKVGGMVRASAAGVQAAKVAHTLFGDAAQTFNAVPQTVQAMPTPVETPETPVEAPAMPAAQPDARTVSSTGPVEQKPYGSVKVVDIDTDGPATPMPTVSLEPRPDLPPSFVPDTTPQRNVPAAARRVERHYDAAMRRNAQTGRLDDVDATYGAGVADAMDAAGLVSPDVAARVTAGENLLPQNRDGYTPQYVADTATYGGGNAAGMPVEFRAVGLDAGERLDAMAGTDMTASTVAAFTQATDADPHVARHFTKHPQASLNRMGVNVRDESECVQVLGALNGLNREQGAEGVARAARAIQASGGTDAAGALDAIERAGKPAPAKPAAAPASDPWGADPGSYDGTFDDFAEGRA